MQLRSACKMYSTSIQTTQHPGLRCSRIRFWCRYNGTPIMDAVRHKQSEVVAFLKRNGAVLHHDKAKGVMLRCCCCSHQLVLTTALLCFRPLLHNLPSVCYIDVVACCAFSLVPVFVSVSSMKRACCRFPVQGMCGWRCSLRGAADQQWHVTQYL